MSANFILEYAGAPVRFNADAHELVQEHEASRFTAEQEAWYAAYKADLNPMRCRVINLYQRNQDKTQNSRQLA